MKMYYTHRIPSTCFSHSCGHLQGVALHRIEISSAFFLGGCRGTRTPKHFVNLTGGRKNFKMFEFSRNQLQTYYGYLSDLLSFL
jgi:hypothetical protein